MFFKSSFCFSIQEVSSLMKKNCFSAAKVSPGLPDGLVPYQKIPIWVNFGGPWNGKCLVYFKTIWNIYSHLAYFMVIWYSLCFLYIFPVLVCLDQDISGSPGLTMIAIWLYVPDD
jgi:hypothetical protein